MSTVFLDRDGVINEDRDDYVKNLRELKIFPNVPESVKRLNDAGFEVIVISNQQGVAKGLISENELREIQKEITRQVEAVGGKISAFYYCKHLASEGCSCRKPRPGLLMAAARDRNIDLSETVFIGDHERDILAGKNAGCKTILVLTGALTRQAAENLECKPDYMADDLSDAVDYMLRHSEKR